MIAATVPTAGCDYDQDYDDAMAISIMGTTTVVAQRTFDIDSDQDCAYNKNSDCDHDCDDDFDDEDDLPTSTIAARLTTTTTTGSVIKTMPTNGDDYDCCLVVVYDYSHGDDRSGSETGSSTLASILGRGQRAAMFSSSDDTPDFVAPKAMFPLDSSDDDAPGFGGSKSRFMFSSSDDAPKLVAPKRSFDLPEMASQV